jgi:hypothetical protein
VVSVCSGIPGFKYQLRNSAFFKISGVKLFKSNHIQRVKTSAVRSMRKATARFALIAGLSLVVVTPATPYEIRPLALGRVLALQLAVLRLAPALWLSKLGPIIKPRHQAFG